MNDTAPMTPTVSDSIGKKYNKLTVVRFIRWQASRAGKREALVEVNCECGTRKELTLGNVRGLNTKSCGCVARDILLARSTKHGHSRRSGSTRTFRVWCNIVLRCASAKNHQSRYYKNYGSRGISVCERWSGPDGFKNFLADMGECPSNKHSIDRIDNSGNYTLGNCRWANAYDQSNNRRNNRHVTVDGTQMTVAQAERALGFHRGRILTRLKLGWTPEESVQREVA